MKNIKYLLSILLLVTATTVTKAQIYEQSMTLGKSKENISRGIVTDSEGNVYFTGIIKDILDFSTSGTPLEFGPSGSNNASYIAKYNANMELVWLKGFTTVSGDAVEAHQLSIDTNDNIYFSCGFKGELKNEPAEITATSETNGSSLFIKYDKNGTLLWHKTIGNIEPTKFQGIAADKDGNVYLSSGFMGTANLETSSIVGEANKYNGFIAKYNAGGNLTWTKKISPDSGNDVEIKKVKTDINGNIYITGNFTGNSILIEGGSAISSGGSSDEIFVAKLNASGSTLWTKTIGGNGSDLVFDIAVDPQENVHLASVVKSTSKLSISKLTSGEYDDISVTNTGKNLGLWTKFDKNGNYLSYTTLGDGSNDAYIHAIAVDESGYAYIGGGASGTTKYTIGGTSQEIKGRGQCDIVVITINPQNEVIKFQRTGGNKNEWASYGSLTLDEKNNKLLLGIQTRSLNCNVGLKYDVHDNFQITAGPENTYSTAFVKYSLMSHIPSKIELRENENTNQPITISGVNKGTVTSSFSGTLPQGVSANIQDNGSIILSGRPVGLGTYYMYVLSENKEDSEIIGYLSAKKIEINVIPGKNVVITTPPSSICFGDEVILEGNVAGTWSGNGVSGNIFRSSVAGLGTHTIRLTHNGEYDEIALTVMESVGSDLVLKLSTTEITGDFRDIISATATSIEQTGAEFIFTINDPNFKKVKQIGDDNKFNFYDSDLLLGENIIYVKMKPLTGCASESGITKSAIINVKEYVLPTVPPIEIDKDEEIRLGANPITDGYLNVLGLPTTARYNARIYNTGGKLIMDEMIAVDGSLNITSLNPGIYVVSVVQAATNRKVETFRIIKK